MNRSPFGRTRNRQLVRVLRLMRELGRGWRRLDELSRELSISTRTVRRDLAAIEEAQLPIRRVRADGRTHWTLKAWSDV